MKAGKAILTALKDGIVSMKGVVKGGMDDVWKTIKDIFNDAPAKFKEIGKNIIEGLKKGFIETVDKVKGAIVDSVASIADGIKDFLGINSPSKLMADEVGKFLPQGIAVGFEAEIPETADDISRSLDGMKIYSASNDNSGRTLFSSIYMPQDDHAAITFAFNSDKKSDGDDSEDVRLDFINSDSGNVIQPRVSNNFSIGTANRKFYNGYFTNLYGSLKGNADTASKAFQDADGNAFADKYATIDITDEWSGKYKKKV